MNPPSNRYEVLPSPFVESRSAVTRRVLVIEDNIDSAQALATLLELNGHEVQTAHEGLGALELAQSFKPDVILLDIGLPGLDGYEVGRRLRESIGSDVILLAMTGYADDKDRERSREAGFNQHLVKPVSPDLLLKMVASPLGT